MSGPSNIEWTEHTWNPFAGCAVVSPGCTNCYAMKMAARLDAMGQALYKGQTKPSKAGPVWRGTVRANPDALLAPLKRRKPTTYFVNSMSDLFYENFSDELIDQVFAVMALSPQHTFQVLTKRAERMLQYFERHDTRGRVLHSACFDHKKDDLLIACAKWNVRGHLDIPWPLPNVWLGVSAERQQEADERIPHLLQTPAAVRFVSCEPLLGALDLGQWLTPKRGCANCGDGQQDGKCCDEPIVVDSNALDQVITGGESGPRARPFSSLRANFRSLRDQCGAAGVAYFHKQNGEWIDADELADMVNAHAGQRPSGYLCTYKDAARLADGRPFEHQSDGTTLIRVGKKSAGRLLDGKEHNAMPKVPA